jgi:[ribosomal protein S5]-alanine N-acetyltransferase
MEITIELLSELDAEAVFEFEYENKTFFEKMVPARDKDYFFFATYQQIHRELVKEQREGRSYFYLIKNNIGTIVGRINLVDIDPISRIGNMGYRVGECYAGIGIAGKAVTLLLKEAYLNHVVDEIVAKTTTNNIASQKVLEKNGFEKLVGHSEGSFVHYSWSAEQYRLSMI